MKHALTPFFLMYFFARQGLPISPKKWPMPRNEKNVVYRQAQQLNKAHAHQLSKSEHKNHFFGVIYFSSLCYFSHISSRNNQRTNHDKIVVWPIKKRER